MAGSMAARVQAYTARVRASYLAAFTHAAPRITAWEQANHRWANQTGAAERGLSCTVEDATTALRLVNVNTARAPGTGYPYPLRLERDYEGRFAILLEALRRHWGAVLADGAQRVRGTGA